MTDNDSQSETGIWDSPKVVKAEPSAKLSKRNNSKTKLDYNIVDKRISAFMLDAVLWIVIFIIATQHFGQITHIVGNGSYMYYGGLTGIPFVVFIVFYLVYYTVLEWIQGGTLGKLIVGIRVIDEKSKKLSFEQSFRRNLLRIVDGFPYIIPNLVGFISASTNDKKQRVGDKNANTVVVKANNNQHASKMALICLLALVVIGVAVIVTVPAYKEVTLGSTSNSPNTLSTSQKSAAKVVSDQAFNYVVKGNSSEVYQLASSDLKHYEGEEEFASGIQQIDQHIIATPQPISKVNYPNSYEALFTYKVQTAKGTKSLVINLLLDNDQWFFIGALLQ